MTEPTTLRPAAPEGGSAAATREAILDAAEALFGDQGIQGASLRAITRAAGVNLAAVNYHFGSKEGLTRAVFQRRLEPVQHRRMALLADCLAAADPPEVECLLRAFLTPVVEFLAADGGPHGTGRFARLVGRAFHEPSGDTQRLLVDLFRPAVTGYTAGFAAALPHLRREEVFWRFHFTVGVLAQTVSLGHMAQHLSGGACDPGDADALLEHLVTFLDAAWRAPSTTIPQSLDSQSSDPSPSLETP